MKDYLFNFAVTFIIFLNSTTIYFTNALNGPVGIDELWELLGQVMYVNGVDQSQDRA